MTRLWRFTSVALLFLTLSCQTVSEVTKVKTPGASSVTKDLLTEEEAKVRATQVSSPRYRIWISMDKSNSDFSGRQDVTLQIPTQLKQPLRMDFEGGTIEKLIVNGSQTDPGPVVRGGFYISQDSFKLGENLIEIHFRHPFSTEGTGLHRFQDPIDGQIYIYSHLEPFHAHWIFPCFDQPDLRASWELTVDAPEDWRVLSNSPAVPGEARAGFKKWTFAETRPLPTYLFALIAGPYEAWTAKAGDIPLGLYARKSLAKHVDYQEWFAITSFGLAFFEKKFGVAYPFLKYDQILVPDFNAGAMENPGAVTFTERFVYRSKVTQDAYQGRANTILHEMAHMWFGDLVTMRWWNGLWLNESFASYMAAVAVAANPNFQGAWQSFFSGTKQWAYWEDQLVTTHPIEGPVADTSQTLTQFDGVTYGKGASVLKLLNFWIGDQAFYQGLNHYFKKHAWSNTDISDFFTSISEASKKDLSGWQRTWLQTTGVNRVEVHWACDESKSKITEMSLIQSPSENNSEIRPHRMKLALFSKSSPNEAQSAVLNIEYFDQETTVPEALDRPCPAAVLPNYEDHDYVKVVLDPVSLKFFSASLSSQRDPLVRQMIWHNLWEMTRDSRLPAQHYLDIVYQHLPSEKNTTIASWVLRTAYSTRPSTTTAFRLLTPELRQGTKERLAKIFKTALFNSAPGGDLQLLWFQSFIQVADSKSLQSLIVEWLGGQNLPKGFKLDQDRRWELIQSLARMGHANSSQLIQAELLADPSDQGYRQSVVADVLKPDTQTKEKWMRMFVKSSPTEGEKPPRLSVLSQAMRNYFVMNQDTFWSSGRDQYFEHLPRLAKQESEEFIGRFARDLYPGLCDSISIERTTTLLENPQVSKNPVLTKALRVQRQEDQRCQIARELSKRALKTAVPANL